jgi:predicted phage-related endonuclease
MIDLELKSRGIGGSEVAAILGLDSDEREIWSVYNKKIGMAEPEVDESTAMRRAIGKDLEQALVHSFSRMTGRRVEWWDKTIQHPERPWQVGSPDALSPSADAPLLGIDAKNVSFDQRYLWGHPDDDDPFFPERYEWQCRWYMSLCDVDEWQIIALLGGSDLRIYKIERDLNIEREMLRDVECFWFNHVLKRVPPDINYSRSARDYVHARYPRSNGKVRLATEEEIAMLTELNRIREAEKMIEQARKETETRVKTAIGEEKGIRSAHYRATWNAPKDTAVVDWRALAADVYGEYVPIDGAKWADMIAKHTTMKPAPRRFLFTNTGE